MTISSTIRGRVDGYNTENIMHDRKTRRHRVLLYNIIILLYAVYGLQARYRRHTDDYPAGATMHRSRTKNKSPPTEQPTRRA